MDGGYPLLQPTFNPNASFVALTITCGVVAADRNED
ncbi:hypothetical protein WG8_0250 [Paenibacillus sp. Aloe-11]|nr:hypothetical protein WG8_0250 [Paenibacillus sp. Aloe-11]